MHQSQEEVKPKGNYVESWPYVPSTQNLHDPKLKFEKVLMMVGIFLPIQIVFGIVLYLIKNFFN